MSIVGKKLYKINNCSKCGEAWKNGHFGKKCEELTKDIRLRALLV